MPWGPNQCEKKIQDFSEAMKQQIEANDIVFATHIPHQNWEMSSWFQFLLVVLQFEIEFQIDNKIGKWWIRKDGFFNHMLKFYFQQED